MNGRPDLSESAVLARYRAELRQVASGTRRLGIGLAIAGIAVALIRARWLPAIPELVPVVLIVTALGLMLLGIVRRTRYHLQRMRDL